MPDRCEKPNCQNLPVAFRLDGQPRLQCEAHWHDTMAALVHGRQLVILRAMQGKKVDDVRVAQFVEVNHGELVRYFRAIGVDV